MKKRYVCYAVWLILACLLYFFENNTGSRIVLACSWLLPFVPRIRHSLFEMDADSRQPKAIPQTIKTFANREQDDPGDVRAYLPGDPVNRIHWKLTAKRDELLVREQAQDKTAEEAEIKAVLEAEQPAANQSKKHIILIGFLVFLFSLILLLIIPSANQGMQALLNRLFDASEAVNAYAYERFAVSADMPVAFAVVLLTVIGISLLVMTLLSGSRLLALGIIAGCALFQMYFGLAFSTWINVLLFALFVLWMLKRPWDKRTILCVLAGVTAVTIAVLLIWPGVDAATETASETVRDRMSQMAQSITGTTHELPSGENETRHVHTQSLATGDQEAQPDREYRLVTVEEEQISMPHWVNYLRIILLLIWAVALVILPFLPFILLNQRRKKALDARKIFDSENVSDAVFAIFQHVAAWLEVMGYGEDNAPYAAWNTELAPDYAERFAACEKLFEEAAYSTHEMKEEDRQQALALLNETEQILQRRADWKQRLRLKYKECLWV
jgi:hypothetical protein